MAAINTGTNPVTSVTITPYTSGGQPTLVIIYKSGDARTFQNIPTDLYSRVQEMFAQMPEILSEQKPQSTTPIKEKYPEIHEAILEKDAKKFWELIAKEIVLPNGLKIEVEESVNEEKDSCSAGKAEDVNDLFFAFAEANKGKMSFSVKWEQKGAVMLKTHRDRDLWEKADTSEKVEKIIKGLSDEINGIFAKRSAFVPNIKNTICGDVQFKKFMEDNEIKILEIKNIPDPNKETLGEETFEIKWKYPRSSPTTSIKTSLCETSDDPLVGIKIKDDKALVEELIKSFKNIHEKHYTHRAGPAPKF